VELAREKAGIPPGHAHQLVLYSAREPLFSIRNLLSPARVPARWDPLPEAPGLPSDWVPALFQLLTRGGMLLLSPFLRG
jgi:hypothetical protein